MKALTRENAVSRTQFPIKVLQFGEGNFLRAFADWIIDILNEKTDFNGAVQIVQPIQNGMGDHLNKQQGLYHVVLNGIQNQTPTREIRLISCVTEVINPYQDYEVYLKLAENPDLKFIISNTTEAGIVFNPGDLSPDALPESFPGKLTTLLLHRFEHFHGSAQSGLVLLPCELIEKNGFLLRNAVLDYIRHWNLPDSFKEWVMNHNTFCNTLVDRIVPGFPKETIGEIQKEIGFEDNLVVMAEPFHLWVIEAPAFVAGLFPADQAGLQVKFVNDLTPYRTRKVRILNGAHTAMVPVAWLNGLRTVRESVDDQYTGNFIRELISKEIIPTLDLPPDELKQFADDVIERFQNPFIRHELSSIALNSISKFKVRVLPSILKYIETRKQMPPRLLLSFAALIRFYKGDWQNQSIPVSDTSDIVLFFKEIWQSRSAEKIVHDVLSNASLWGQDLTLVKGLANEITLHLNQIESQDENISALLSADVTLP